MSTKNKALLGLGVLALAMLIGGLLRSDLDTESFVGANGSGESTRLILSPFVFLGLLLLALAFGWHKFGRTGTDG